MANRQYVEALKYARGRIKNGRYWFICHALPDGITGDRLRKLINKRLRARRKLRPWSTPTVEGWLFEKGFAVAGSTPRHYFKEYRLRWIDSLIEEFSK